MVKVVEKNKFPVVVTESLLQYDFPNVEKLP